LSEKIKSELIEVIKRERKAHNIFDKETHEKLMTREWLKLRELIGDEETCL